MSTEEESPPSDRHADSDASAAEDPAHAGYQPDPDAPPTVEGRVQQAGAELTKLLRASLLATVVMGVAVGLWDLWRGIDGYPTTIGYLVGAAVATLNLWILAGGFFALMRGGGASGRALLAFGGSFLGLVLLAFFIVLAKREWTVGFALGLTTPAVAGILYGRSLQDGQG